MDHEQTVKRKPHPRKTSNILSKILFLFVLKIYKKGYSKDLEEQDLYEVVPNLKATKISNKLEENWKKQKQQSLLKLLWTCYGFELIFYGVVDFIVETISIVIRPYALSKLLTYFKKGQTEYTKQDACFYAALLISFSLFEKIYSNNFYFLIMQFGIKIRTALCSFMYRKALKLNPSHAVGNISIGKIITLISKDVLVFEYYTNSINQIWTAIIKTFVVSYVLFNKIGISTFLGISLLIINLPFQFYIGCKMIGMKLKMCKKTDDRLQTTQETLSAMRIIKMYTWEKIFNRKISDARKSEVNYTYRLFFLRFTAIELAALNAHIALYLMLMTYLWQGNYLTADIVYYVVENFQSLDFTLSVIFPISIYGLSEAKAAIQRIESVLKATEIQTNENDSTISTGVLAKVKLTNVMFTLQNKIILNKITLNLKHGLTIMAGRVGSGKSTIFKTILRDYQPQSGNVIVQGTVSYASQEPWLFPSTIKQNIIFGEEYNDKRYQEVLKVCALVYDFQLLKSGDGTIVEDRGINLSKGQQVRINLARAVYRNSDIYLLDDCLATLDANVSSYIFQECFKKFLNNKIVVLATHNMKYLKEADTLVYVENGELISEEIKVEESKLLLDKINTQKLDEKTEKKQSDFEDNFNENSELLSENIVEKRVYQETKQTGAVSLEVYKDYIKLGGGFILFFFVFAAFGLTQYISRTSDKVLSDWVNLEEKLLNFSSISNLTEDENNERESKHQLYSIVTVSLALSYFLRAYAIFFFSRIACLRLHKKMINNIINCTMQYFDNTYIGNILNRFSKDLATVDEVIPFVFYYTFQIFLTLVGTVIMIIIVNSNFILPTVIFAIILLLLRSVASRTSRSLKRLDSATRSPIVGYLNATLEGLTTIRAFKAEKILRDEFDRHLDLFTSAYYTLYCSIKGLAVIVDICCSCFLIYVISKFLWGEDVALAGTVGLAISQATRLSGSLQWAIQQWIEIENQMTAVERVLEYTTIKTENKQGLEIENWPKSGQVIYENVSLSYSNSENYILKNLNFTIKPSEKIGIVGRTGAGKSSIIASLFRLYEIEGRILIDGIDTKTLSLDFLRKNISIIPQDPVLFTGTIRENIDPLNSFTDDEIWNAIEIANLKPLVPSLDYEITDSGANFSIGQRQLICLARACVLKNKIIVLDEATANMDQESDSLICETIKNKFNKCTVFTIAHKLQTIVDSNRIMVLDKGQIVEFDSPETLLKNQNCIFYRMALKDGIIK